MGFMTEEKDIYAGKAGMPAAAAAPVAAGVDSSVSARLSAGSGSPAPVAADVAAVPAARELRRYDVALYRRGEKYVLHRVVGHYENGSEKGYVICGDNCVTLEYIPRENVLGVLSGFYRDGRHIDCETSRGYHAYSKLWVALFPVRKVCKSASAMVRRAGKRVLFACGLRKCKGADDVAVGGAVDGVAAASGSADNTKREAGRK